MGMQDEFSPQRKVFDALKSHGYPSPVISGIMGNIGVETGGSYEPTQKQYGSGPGRGLFQMEGKMLKAYNKYLSKTKLPNTTETQVGFMHDILQSDRNYDIGAGNRGKIKHLFTQIDPAYVAEGFSNIVLRPGKPHMNRRLRLAQEFHDARYK